MWRQGGGRKLLASVVILTRATPCICRKKKIGWRRNAAPLPALSDLDRRCPQPVTPRRPSGAPPRKRGAWFLGWCYGFTLPTQSSPAVKRRRQPCPT